MTDNETYFEVPVFDNGFRDEPDLIRYGWQDRIAKRQTGFVR
tara:strand:- start:118 stop:243 length:126 start_codon:yes stop_codon:yes gene_type:complete